MENPRPEKVAVVDEVREKLRRRRRRAAHRVPRPDRVRSSPRCAASCARPAASTRSTRTPSCASPPARSGIEQLDELLVGPTAIAFVNGDAAASPSRSGTSPARTRPGGERRAARQQGAEPGRHHDPRRSAVARGAARSACRCSPGTVVQLAGLLQAVPRNFAYGLKALIDQGGGGAPAKPSPKPGADEPRRRRPAESAPTPRPSGPSLTTPAPPPPAEETAPRPADDTDDADAAARSARSDQPP